MKQAVLLLGCMTAVVWSQQQIRIRKPNVSENEVKLSMMSSLLEHAYMQNTNCIFVLLHDYPPEDPLPEALRGLLRRLSGFPVLVIPWNEKTPVPPRPASVFENYWFSWLQRDTARPLGHCGLYAIIYSKAEYVKPMLHHLALQMIMQPSHWINRFVFWPRSSPDAEVENNAPPDMLKDAMLEEDASRVLMSLGVSFQKRSEASTPVMQLWHNCHYCGADHKPAIVYGGTFDDVGRKRTPPGGGIDSLTDDLFIDYTHDLHWKHLNGTLVLPISSEEVRYLRESFLPMIPFFMALLDIGDVLHFSWHMDPMEDNKNAGAEAPLPDGNWTGCTGDVLSRRTDIGWVIQSHDGYRVVDYSIPLYFSYITFVIRQPKVLASWKSILLPFTPAIWSLILAATLVSAAFLWCLMWFGPPEPPASWWQLASLSLRWTFLAYMDQGVDADPPEALRCHAPRLFLVFFWFYAMLILNVYEADLMSFLTAPEREQLPKDFWEMMNWPGGWTWGMAHYSHTYMVILTKGLPSYFYEMVVKSEVLPDITQCVANVQHGDYSCISIPEELLAWSYQLVDKTGYNPTQVVYQDLTGRSMSLVAGYILEKHSVFTPILNRMTQYMYDSGLLVLYEDRYSYCATLMGLKAARKEDRLHEASVVVRPLKMSMLAGPFFFLIIVWGVGFLVFISPFIKSKCAGIAGKRKKTN